MTQKQQLARLDEFRDGQVNVLVATSVGEEGLDVPAADLVLMYEPVPSAIRSIQRRGRTARQSSGTVKTLVTKDTRDQFVSHAAKARERKMYNNLAEIERQGRIQFRPNSSDDSLSSFEINVDGEIISSDKFLELETVRLASLYPTEKPIEVVDSKTLQSVTNKKTIIDAKDKRPRNQTGLDDFFGDQSDKVSQSREQEIESINAANEIIDTLTDNISATITLDHREASSTLSAYISSLGMTVQYENLTTGDILIHGDILIERKTSRDLLTSIIDQRLFKQCQRMKNAELQPLLLIELGEIGNSVHPNAVLGALAHVTLDLGIPILTTKDSMESAHLVYLIAKQSGQFSKAIREFVKSTENDEAEVIKCCEAATIEISNMVNNNNESEYLLQKWNDSGLSKQIELLSSITNFEYKVCAKLINKYQSIAGFFKQDLDELAKELTKEELAKISTIF